MNLGKLSLILISAGITGGKNDWRGFGQQQNVGTPKAKDGYEWCHHCGGYGMCSCASCGVDTVKQSTAFEPHHTFSNDGRLLSVEKMPYTKVETNREAGICKVCNGIKQIKL